jgi:hypothetical protein
MARRSAPIALVAPKTRPFAARLGPADWPKLRRERVLQDFVDVVGASGASYRFMRLKDGRPLSPMGGNYLYARYTAGRFELIFAGEAQNLLQDGRARWDEAARRFQAAEMFSRLNISERVRQLELTDIVEATRPPMNVAPDRQVG